MTCYTTEEDGRVVAAICMTAEGYEEWEEVWPDDDTNLLLEGASERHPLEDGP